MNLENFFIYSELIKERRLDIGFNLYDAGHLAWLFIVAVSAVIASNFYKRTAPERKTKIKKIFAAALLISEILKDITLLVQGADMLDYLPLHLCSFTILVMMLHSYGRWQRLTGQFFAYALFPGAAAALLFCNWTEYPYFSYMNIHSFLFHGWIVIYFIMLYRSREIRPSYKGLWNTVLAMVTVSVPVYLFNLAFSTNYLFLNEASDGSPLVIVWELFGTRFGAAGYLTGVVLMALVVFHILYAVYRLLDITADKKRGI